MTAKYTKPPSIIKKCIILKRINSDKKTTGAVKNESFLPPPTFIKTELFYNYIRINGEVVGNEASVDALGNNLV